MERWRAQVTNSETDTSVLARLAPLAADCRHVREALGRPDAEDAPMGDKKPTPKKAGGSKPGK
jgi:hypothetical protein